MATHYTPLNYVANRNSQKSQLHIMVLTQEISETGGRVTDYFYRKPVQRKNAVSRQPEFCKFQNIPVNGGWLIFPPDGNTIFRTEDAQYENAR